MTTELHDKLERVRRVGSEVNRLRTQREICERLVDLVAEAFRIDICGLFTLERGGLLRFVAQHEYPLAVAYREITFDDGIVGAAAAGGQSVMVDDVRADPRYIEGVPGVASELAVPLVFEDDVLAVLDVESFRPTAFSRVDQSLLEMLANHAARSLAHASDMVDTAEAVEDARRLATRNALLNDISTVLAGENELTSAMQYVVDTLSRQLGFSQAAVLLLDPLFEELELVSAYGYGEVSGLRIPLSKGVTGYAVRHAVPVNIADVTTDPRYVKGIHAGRSELVVPIFIDREVCGVIDVESPIPDAFSANHVALLEAVAAHAATAIRTSRRLDELARARVELGGGARSAGVLIGVTVGLRRFETARELLDGLPALIAEISGWSDVALWTPVAASGELLVQSHVGDPPAQRRLGYGEQAVGEAAERGQVVSQGSWIAAPLSNWDELAGVLAIRSVDGSVVLTDELMEGITAAASTALTTVDLESGRETQLRALDERTRRLDLLNRVARSLTQRFDLDALLDEILRLCAEAFELTHCAVLLLDNSRGVLDRRAALGYAEDAPRLIELGQGVTGYVADSGVPALVADVTQDPRYVTGVFGGRSEMATPLKVFGEVIGVLDAESADECAFDDDDLDLFTSFAAQAAYAIHNARLTAALDSTARGPRT